MGRQIATNQEDSPAITRRFVVWLAIFAGACVAWKPAISDVAAFMSWVAIVIESVEQLLFWLIIVAVATVIIRTIWNQAISRFTSAPEINWLEALSLVLIFSLFDVDGFNFSASSSFASLRLLVVSLGAGFFIQQMWQRLLTRLVPCIRPWNYPESIAVYALSGILL